MRVRLLVSAARITLCIAILSFTLVGDPDAATRAAMQSETGSLADLRASIESTVERLRSGVQGLSAPPTATPRPTANLAPSPLPTTQPQGSPPTWIEARSINLDAPVVEIGWKMTTQGGVDAVEWEVPDSAAGFHKGSAYPGRPGNTVISGHHNMGGEVFRYLIDLKIDDEIILYVGQTPYRYRVTQKEIVREQGASEEQRRENAKWIAPTSDERLTLVTCWPYTGNSHRLIVVAKPER